MNSHRASTRYVHRGWRSVNKMKFSPTNNLSPYILFVVYVGSKLFKASIDKSIWEVKIIIWQIKHKLRGKILYFECVNFIFNQIFKAWLAAWVCTVCPSYIQDSRIIIWLKLTKQICDNQEIRQTVIKATEGQSCGKLKSLKKKCPIKTLTWVPWVWINALNNWTLVV